MPGAVAPRVSDDLCAVLANFLHVGQRGLTRGRHSHHLPSKCPAMGFDNLKDGVLSESWMSSDKRKCDVLLHLTALAPDGRHVNHDKSHDCIAGHACLFDESQSLMLAFCHLGSACTFPHRIESLDPCLIGSSMLATPKLGKAQPGTAWWNLFASVGTSFGSITLRCSHALQKIRSFSVQPAAKHIKLQMAA